MIYSLKILSEASVDIKEITEWYKNISPHLARRFISQFYDGLSKIADRPNAFFNLTKRVRRYKLPGFPYLLIFIIEQDQIILFAVMHERRNPKTWKNRIKKK